MRKNKKPKEYEDFGITEQLAQVVWGNPYTDIDEDTYCPAGLERQFCSGCYLAENCRWLSNGE